MSYLLQKYTLNPEIIRELEEYTNPTFLQPLSGPPLHFPLPDEQRIGFWREQLQNLPEKGILGLLSQCYTAFNFPIQQGIHTSPAYRLAASGMTPIADIPEATGLPLKYPEQIHFSIYPGCAGRVPVLTVPDALDFARVIQAICHRNQPVVVPPSKGAVMLRGLTNRMRWKQFRENSGFLMLNKKTLSSYRTHYTDTLLILSKKPYSNVSHTTLGLSEREWLSYSYQIRLQHEYTHYFTHRLFGIINNNLMDELLADYMGVRLAAGHFRADWFLHFMGLEDYPRYRKEGRMENYRKYAALSPAAFDIVKTLLFEAAHNLEKWDREWETSTDCMNHEICRLLTLTTMRLEEVGSADGTKLVGLYREQQEKWGLYSKK